jgi:site-specific DNA-methyltransferase (adenine-specific)
MTPYYQHAGITIYHGDCLEIMPTLPAASVDLVLCDLPYGTTSNPWDTVIPFAPLWAQYKRLRKGPSVPVVLHGSQPFTTDLINSNRAEFKYEWIWDKTKGGCFALAKKQPMKSHENVVVFYGSQPLYNPQKEVRGKPRKKGGGKASGNFGIVPSVSYNNEYYPRTIVVFSTGSRVDHWHPTQKPTDLAEYLIRTYTNPGDAVLDNCMGSGTTLVAAKNLGRKAIGIEIKEKYCEIAAKRLSQEAFDFS